MASPYLERPLRTLQEVLDGVPADLGSAPGEAWLAPRVSQVVKGLAVRQGRIPDATRAGTSDLPVRLVWSNDGSGVVRPDVWRRSPHRRPTD